MKDLIIRERIRQINNGTIRPMKAKGHVTIDLTDPITGKIKERICGDNHVFLESLFSVPYDSNAGRRWTNRVSNMWLCLNDSNALDTTFPYLLGQTIGYGRPSIGSSGNLRGAYSSANQVLAEQTLSSIRWKFQYDFTTAQANGTIASIGLTGQYGGISFAAMHASNYRMVADATVGDFTNDGRYSYACSTAGIITVYDLWSETTSTIDVSATTGTTAATTKTVGYAPATGKYYVWAYNSTSSLRKMYVFTDNTFGTLENTYTPTNIVQASVWPFYVEGNYAYFCTNSSNTIRKADFVNNVSYTVWTISEYNAAAYTENTNSATLSFANYGTTVVNGYLIVGAGRVSNAYNKVVIIDLATETVLGYLSALGSGVSACCQYPKSVEKLISNTHEISSSLGSLHNAAITNYILPTPLTKTSANGMTATYELEVFW